MKVWWNQVSAAAASSSVLYPTNPNLRDVPSDLYATLTSVRIPAGHPCCSKCCRRRIGVTYEGKFLIINRDMVEMNYSEEGQFCP
jgi:hypothetical protein